MSEATNKPADNQLRPTVISLRPGIGSSLTEITLIGPPRGCFKPRDSAFHYPGGIHDRSDPSVDPLLAPPSSLVKHTVLINPKKIPRPPNAFMIFANEWRKPLAQEFPSESNKSISVRLGQIWKTMSKSSKETYFQRSRQEREDHKQKYPGYVYNPKEARMRKALREETKGIRKGVVAPPRWPKHTQTMNKSLVSSLLVSQLPRCTDNTKTMLHEQVDRDNMLQSYPDYLDLPYNIPSSDYALDNQSWCPYVQGGAQGYMDRLGDTKLPVDWSTPYSSEQGNFIHASPQSSPYSMRSQPEVNTMLLNGDRGHSEQPVTSCDTCLVADHKPVVDPVISVSSKDPEQHVKDLLASTQIIPEVNPEVNGKQEDSGNTRLPGFHQAFGSTEIGRFSQPDGFFEAAVAAENERKVCMSPLPPPPPKRGRAPRGGRKSKSRVDSCLPMGHAMPKKDSWQEWNPGMQPGCDNPVSSLQRMNCYPYHEEQRPPMNCPYPPQWHPDTPYYERPGCNQYYPPYYNPPQEPVRSYHDCYTPYDYPPPSWRSHPYYHPTHFPHHQNVGYYQQYSEYRHYGYQNNRWAVNREIKYSSGMV